MLVHKLAQERDSVHTRHLDVEQYDVGPLHFHSLHGEEGIGHRRDDLDPRVSPEELDHNPAHHGRVIHNHDLDRAHAGFR